MIFEFISYIVFLAYASLILLVYFGWLRLIVFRISKQEQNLKISVIVAVRNEEENIKPLLESLLQQEYPVGLVEIIIVDDHSDDDTLNFARLALAMLKPDCKVKLFSLEPGDGVGKKAALHRGIQSAAGELIVITDADCIAGKSWLSAISAFYKKNLPQMILGPVKMTDGGTIFGKLQSLEFSSLISSAAGSCGAGFPLLANGANIAFTRKAYEECHGFSGNLQYASGDDMFLMMSIKKKYGNRSIQFLKSPYAIINTPSVAGFGSFLQQRLRWVSKSRGYTDFPLNAASVIVFLANTILLAAAISLFFFPSTLKLFLILYFIKLVVDLPLLASFSRFQKSESLLWLLPFMEVINSVYTFFIGISGNIVKFEWKGRKL